MEPITLCGLVIVAFGFWVEFEAILKVLVKPIGNSKMLAGIRSLFSEQKPVYANRYARYTR